MYTPKRFHSRVGTIGQKLPDPFPSLGHEGIHFRRGATSMVAGVPGTFKSIWALNAVHEWSKHGVSVMYFSADGDEFTVVRRLAAIITGDNADVVESRMTRNDTERYEKALATLDGIEFEYEQFDFEEMVIRIKSYEQVYGAFPDVIVLDNLIDFVSSYTAFDEMQVLIKEFDGLAKEVKSHVLFLHHARLVTPKNPGKPLPMDKPPRDDEISGKLTQLPTVALTMAAAGLNLNISCVKNRNGKQYRDASSRTEFVVLQNMQVREKL